MFDRFRQANGTTSRVHGGLGLGPAIVRYLVESHGGSVHAESAGEGQGATFTVPLSLAHTGEMSTLAGRAGDERDMGRDCPPGLIGLLVDDQLDILELLHDMLAPCGALVRACDTAREALKVLREWKPDVLISDIAMPGEDGYWLIRNVRALTPEDGGSVHALALTAHVRMEDRLGVLAAGFEQYVPKPVDPSELRDVVARLVWRRSRLPGVSLPPGRSVRTGARAPRPGRAAHASALRAAVR